MEAVMSKTQSTAPQLSESQLVILAAAAQRDDGSLLPIPQSLTAKGAALTKVMETLCKRKLIEERRTINGAPEWRRDEERHPLGLFITTSGLLALGVNNPEKEKPAQAAASMSRQRKTAAAKPPAKARRASPANSKGRAAPSQSKQDRVIRMLRRQSGVTVEDIIAKTGWQPHSVRGFFSGLVKKKLKLPLTSEVGKDGVRRYHIAPIASSKS
jgi:DNA-binding MarR family transcriptional regulator